MLFLVKGAELRSGRAYLAPKGRGHRSTTLVLSAACWTPTPAAEAQGGLLARVHSLMLLP